MTFLSKLHLQGLLSFPPVMEPIELQPLNVLIGPNGAGKTNLIEALELLRALPTGLGDAIRNGGGVEEWLWKGEGERRRAAIDVEMGDPVPVTERPLRYRLEFAAANHMPQILVETVEDANPTSGRNDPHFYYRLREGEPVALVENSAQDGERKTRLFPRREWRFDQSIFEQRKSPEHYPELTWAGQRFAGIRAFREWTFGARSELRTPQRVDDPSDELLPSARNLALVLNEFLHRHGRLPDEAMKRFLPRYERVSIRTVGGSVQLYLHEEGLETPIPTTRTSDGTLRFLAILATLHAPVPPPLLCLEEPELGMHPDAVALLAELLVEASSRMQLVVTTHSSTLLSGLNDQLESVLVCENNGYGTIVDRLDPNRLAFWLKDYALGDIWRMGEIGGNT